MTRLNTLGSILVLAVGGVAMLSFTMAADDSSKQEPAVEANQQEPGNVDPGLRHFMRMKLDASSKVLEGLAVEDFALIKEGAKKMNEMSTAEQWRVSNDALYRNFSGDFQRVTKDLMDAAEAENLDRAALYWMAATMNCIECHRYARGVMIAANSPTPQIKP